MAVFMGFLRRIGFMEGPGQPSDIPKISGTADFPGFLPIQFIIIGQVSPPYKVLVSGQKRGDRDDEPHSRLLYSSSSFCRIFYGHNGK